MNSKTVFKRILPIVIAILVVVIIAVVSTVATGDKKNPVLSGKDDSYIVYTTANGQEIKVSKEKVWNTLKGSVTAATTTVSEFVDQIDKELLKEYVDKVTVKEVSEKIAQYLFGKTFDEYVKANKAAWEVAAKKNGGNDWQVEAIKAIKEVLKTKQDELKYSYGISADLTDTKDVTYLANGALIETAETDEDGNKVYGFTVKEGSALYEYYKVPVARTNYALEKLTDEYLEEVVEYNAYLEAKEAYEEYLKDLEDYEEDLEDWKKNGKKGDKPVKPNEVKQPEEVEAPILVESDFEKIYTEENQNKYWAILVPYASNQAAVDALYQQNIVIAKNYEGNYVWFNAANLAKASDAARAKYAEREYSVRGDAQDYTSGIITDNEFYELLMTQTEFDNYTKVKENIIVTDQGGQNNDLAAGAYALSEAEIKAAILKLYNQFYQANAEKQLAADYTGKEEVLEYTEAELKELSLFSTATSNKFNSFDAESKDFSDFYSNKVVTAGSKYYVYLILAKEEVTDWEDAVKAAEEDYTKTDFFKAYVDLSAQEPVASEKLIELLETKLTTTYTNEKVAALRVENELKIYDADLEAAYMTTYTSDYKAVKKSSKDVVAAVEGLEVKLDALFETLTKKYGILTALESYQYDWMFLEANYGSKDDLANVYVDYAAYKEAGKNLAKYVYDTDEAQELYKDVQTYVTNTKNNFASGAYESQGYPANYGWENFMQDYFLESYGIEVKSTDDLALFYIYQQIVDDYSKHLAKLNKEAWDEVIAVYMAQQLSSYINTTGVHFLISYNDAEGKKVDPVNWPTDQKFVDAYTNLFNQVNNIVRVVPKDKVASVLTEIVNAYNEAPLLLDGQKPNASYDVLVGTDENDEDVKYTENVLKYTYTYYAPGNREYTVDLSTPKSLGLTVSAENLTVTEGQMVEPFENAVRTLWNAKLADLLNGETVNEKQVYGKMIETTFGYHLYVNLTMSMSNYQTTKDDDTTFVTLPSYDHAVMYIYEANENAEEDYVSFADLLEDLEDAEDDKNEEKIASVKEEITNLFKELGLEYEAFEQLREVLEAYAGKDSAYTKSQLNTWFATYSASNGSTTFSNVYSDFTGSAYYQLKVLQAILANKAGFSTGDVAALEDYLTHYCDSYYNSLTNASGLIEFLETGKMDKEELESLLAIVYTTTALTSDLTDTFKAYAPGFDKLFEIAKAASADYEAADFEGNALKGFEIVNK